jgi:hypothetical protein
MLGIRGIVPFQAPRAISPPRHTSGHHMIKVKGYSAVGNRFVAEEEYQNS